MSYGASAFRINFEKLLGVRGSRDTQLLAGLLRDNPDEVDDFDEDEEDESSVSQALTAIINGGPVEDEFSPVWAIASLIIYDHFGVRLDANAISPSQPAILEFVTTALRAKNLDGRVPIFDSGRTPPLLTEVPDPFPVMFHMTPGEVSAARGLLARADWLDQTQEVRDTIAMIDAWIEEAARHNEGIVCAYL